VYGDEAIGNSDRLGLLGVVLLNSYAPENKMETQIIHEPKRRCEFCGEWAFKEEMFKVLADGGDYLEICESCHEAGL